RADVQPRPRHRREDAPFPSPRPAGARARDALHLAQHGRGRGGLRPRHLPPPRADRRRGNAARRVASRPRRRFAGRRGPARGVPQDLARGDRVSGRVRRIRALLFRYLLLVRRDPSRVVDLAYWPFIDIAIWGLLTVFVSRAGVAVPNAIGV